MNPWEDFVWDMLGTLVKIAGLGFAVTWGAFTVLGHLFSL